MVKMRRPVFFVEDGTLKSDIEEAIVGQGYHVTTKKDRAKVTIAFAGMGQLRAIDSRSDRILSVISEGVLWPDLEKYPDGEPREGQDSSPHVHRAVLQLLKKLNLDVDASDRT